MIMMILIVTLLSNKIIAIILTMNTFCDGTNQSDKYKTYPAENPGRQLDYIYTCNKGEYIIDSYHVIDAPIFSDHLPIISDIFYKSGKN
mgnify:CR=1 FL=1